jgi:ATP-dependent Clp protease ATP-binding subunit ClpC|tara:strand:+ start:20756 stop:22777 length:2022 start_codon:yes stop_codon:yes gene_type:complete
MIESVDPNEKGGGKKKKEMSNSKTPVLDNFSRDLIKLASEGKLDPVVGREREITRIAQILSRRKKNNPIIIGEPGCGKTAIVEGLAMKIFEGDCPQNLCDKRIVSLDMTSIVAGTKYRGQFEERMKVILDELHDNHDIIVFIDEIHTIIGAGNTSGSLDASNIFKPALARGEIQCVGATTLDEYRENIEKDGALERRFQKVMVDGSTPEETMEILINLKSRYEDHHKVSYTDASLEACVTLSGRYVTDREFPDKAIDVMDEVGARAQINVKLPEVIEKLRAKAFELKEKKIQVVKRQKYEEAAQLRDEEKKIIETLEFEKRKFEEEKNDTRKVITEDMVYEVVSTMTRIPLSKLSNDDKESLLELEDSLNNSVIGQEEAVKIISKSIRRNRVGIKDPNRPIGSFIFLGSTGIGKTHLAKQLAKEIFGDEESLIRMDMSEYQEKYSMSRLIGSPPGYVGYDQGGQLTEAVKNKPYSVVLFDEIEKANKDIFSLLLQMMDDGHMTDSFGRKINFKNCLIIMTSNLGVKKLQDFGTGVGFDTSNRMSNNEELKKSLIQKELKNHFTPEFLNRVDEVVIFNPLRENEVEKIVEIELSKLNRRLVKMGYKVNIDPKVKKYLSEVGFDEKYGARPIKRAIQEKIEDLISEEVLRGNIVEGKACKLKMKGKEEVVLIKGR